MPDERSTRIRAAIAAKDVMKLRDIRSELIQETSELRKKVDAYITDAHWTDISTPEGRKKREQLVNDAHIARAEWTKKNREFDELSRHIDRMSNLVGTR